LYVGLLLLYTLPITCLIYFVLLDLLIRVISDEEYKFRSSSLHNFLQPPVNYVLISQNVFLTMLLLSNTVSLRFFPQYDRPNFTPVYTITLLVIFTQ
jgi:hypothetical protein